MDVLNYVSPVKFDPTLVRVVATCKPRWGFSLRIYPISEDSSDKPNGIIRAFYYLGDFEDIISRGDIFANLLVDRLPNAGVRRLGVCSTIFRGKHYLSEKKRPLCTATCDAIRGYQDRQL